LNVVIPLVRVAEDFSPRYERHTDDLVTIDVSGLERLLGPPRAIAQELQRAAAARVGRVHVAVARTRTAALAIALARPGISVIETGQEAAALAPLPLRVLEAVLEHLTPARERLRSDAFKQWGVRTLGELAALPPADLAARLGPAAREWQAVARGEDTRPLIPTLAEERFESSLELEWPIEELEPLSFVVTRLLEPLSIRLERRDRGAAVLHVLLRLVTRTTWARRLQLPSPMRDVRTLRTLALLDLESHPPDAAIDRVTIVIDPTPGRILQHALFTRPHPTPEQLSTLVARLGVLMGHDRFGAPATLDSYRPGGFEMKPFATERDDRDDDHRRGRRNRREDFVHMPARSALCAVTPVNIVAALRRCRQPVPARVVVEASRPVRVTTDRRGFAGGRVTRCTGPWRTSGEWWTGPACWHRDEWDVHLSDGAGYRIFQDREIDAWFIDAIVD
jgi:protein ImuB